MPHERIVCKPLQSLILCNRQLVTMSLSRYIRDACDMLKIKPDIRVKTPMMANNYLQTGAMTKESVKQRLHM